MEYHVMRFVAVLHDWRVGEHVTSERATEASLPSLPLVSLALHSFHSGSYRHHRCVARENWRFVNFCLLFRFIMKNVTNIQEVVSVVRGETSEYLREHCKCETTVEVYPHWRQETNKASESLSYKQTITLINLSLFNYNCCSLCSQLCVLVIRDKIPTTKLKKQKQR